jgi:hypothetical protein
MTNFAAMALVLAAALLSPHVQACPRSADRALTGAAVGQDMVVNGLPVQIQQVSAREDPRAIIERVEAAWRSSGFDVKRRVVGPWMVVSALSNECLATLQLIGFFAISQPDKARPVAVKRDLPLPPGAHVVSTVSAKDGARASTTTTVAAKSSVNDTRDHFLSGLTGAGWDSVRAHGLRRPGSMSDAQVLSAQRGAEMVQVVIFTAHGATTAIISRAESL